MKPVHILKSPMTMQDWDAWFKKQGVTHATRERIRALLKEPTGATKNALQKRT